MFTKTFFIAAAAASTAFAQQAAYAQCGGEDWTGSTSCVSGYTCEYNSEYYSQCMPSGDGKHSPHAYLFLQVADDPIATSVATTAAAATSATSTEAVAASSTSDASSSSSSSSATVYSASFTEYGSGDDQR